MCPCLTLHDTRNIRKGTGILSSNAHQGPTLLAPFSNLSNLPLSQAGIRVLFASHVAFSTLCAHISNVVCLSAKKQMFRVYATPVITSVQAIQVGRDASESEFICNTMRVDNASMPLESPVTRSVPTTDPQPTRLGLKNFVPEPLFDCYTVHANASNSGVGRAGDVSASPGLFMLNYSMNGGQ